MESIDIQPAQVTQPLIVAMAPTSSKLPLVFCELWINLFILNQARDS